MLRNPIWTEWTHHWPQHSIHLSLHRDVELSPPNDGFLQWLGSVFLILSHESQNSWKWLSVNSKNTHVDWPKLWIRPWLLNMNLIFHQPILEFWIYYKSRFREQIYMDIISGENHVLLVPEICSHFLCDRLQRKPFTEHWLSHFLQ